MIKYAAFLRGINVGGKKLIKMEALRRVVESLGLKNVRTFIASGNVLFETSQTNRDALTRKIEKKLLKSSPKLPLKSAIENLEVLAIQNRAAFILCRRKKNGMFSFPNNFFEKEFGVTATTRQWNTINRIVDFADNAKVG